jgi:hypothetical protein
MDTRSVKQFSLYSLYSILSSLVLFIVFYTIGAIATYPRGSIPGSSVFGKILILFGWYLPMILFIGVLLLIFINFFVNNPRNTHLSLCHLFFGLSIVLIALTSSFAILFIIFPWLAIILNSVFPILSIIYGHKAKQEIKEWNIQCWTIIVLSALAVLASVIIWSLVIFNPPSSI